MVSRAWQRALGNDSRDEASAMPKREREEVRVGDLAVADNPRG